MTKLTHMWVCGILSPQPTAIHPNGSSRLVRAYLSKSNIRRNIPHSPKGPYPTYLDRVVLQRRVETHPWVA